MQGVVVVLKGEASEVFAKLQDEAAAEFGARLLAPGHIPHATLHLAEQYDLAALDRTVKSLARSETAFSVNTEGVGVFSGETPVVYWPVVRTNRLSLLQRVLAQEAAPAVTAGLSEFCDPHRWIPHVTLGTASDFTFAGKLTAWLLARSPRLEMTVDELVIGEDSPDGTRILARHPFEG
jgi:2'-5' RNA ligase